MEILSYGAIIIGLPIGLYKYFQTKKKEQLNWEYTTYNALDEKYLEFQRLCLSHPELNIFDIPDKNPKPLNDMSPQEKKEELIAFTMLISIFERAYLMYHDQTTHMKAKQWKGWKEYIISYSRRENFIRAWEISGGTFDEDFTLKFMVKKIGLPIPNSR